MPAPEVILQLVQQFRENQTEYKSARHNEAQLRHEFLDKFFEALGWDVYNKAGGVYYTPKYIVDYIVANTVGKLLEGKTPDQTSLLKIVDIITPKLIQFNVSKSRYA